MSSRWEPEKDKFSIMPEIVCGHFNESLGFALRQNSLVTLLIALMILHHEWILLRQAELFNKVKNNDKAENIPIPSLFLHFCVSNN